jgi:hypothetical protein
VTLVRPAGSCRLLRCKGSYLPTDPLPADVEVELNPAAVFWCLRSQGMVGPDDGPVEPEKCRAGRRCFERRGE